MKIIGAIFATILSIFFTIILTGGIFLAALHTFLSSENLVLLFHDIEITNMIKVDDIEELKDVQDYLEIPEVNELMEKLITGSFDYILQDKELPLITENDIEKIVNSDYLENELGTELTKEEKNDLRESLTELYTVANENMKEELDTIRNELFADETVKTLLTFDYATPIIISLLILALLIGVCRWSWYRPLSWIGIATFIAGLLNILASIGMSFLMKGELKDIVASKIMINMFDKWMLYGLLFSIIGVILVIFYFISKKYNQTLPKDEMIDTI